MRKPRLLVAQGLICTDETESARSRSVSLRCLCKAGRGWKDCLRPGHGALSPARSLGDLQQAARPQASPAPLQGRVTTAAPTPRHRTWSGGLCHPGLGADPPLGGHLPWHIQPLPGPPIPPEGAHTLRGAAARSGRKRGWGAWDERGLKLATPLTHWDRKQVLSSMVSATRRSTAGAGHPDR